MPEHHDPAHHYLTFRVGKRPYAVPAGRVAEVIHVPRTTRMPHSPAALLGVADVQGNVLPVVDVAALLGWRAAAAPATEGAAGADGASGTARAIVLRDAAPAVLVVDGIDALDTVQASSLQDAGAELAGEAGERLAGAFRRPSGDEIAKILDVDAMLHQAFSQRASRAQARSALVTEATDNEATALPAGGDDASDREDARIVTFEVAGQEFGLDLEVVQEIVPGMAASVGVPHADAVVIGVTQLRGRLLPLLSMRALLGFAAAESSGRERVVVTRAGPAVVGLVVDAARTVMTAHERQLDAMPAALAARQQGESRIRAIYRADAGARLVSILEPERLFREDVMQRLRARHEGAMGAGKVADAAADADADADAAAQAAAGNEDAPRRSLLVFRLDGDEFGLPIEAVDEVAQLPARITRVPRTPAFLEGVTSLRGEVLPVIDLRRRFEMPSAAEPQSRRLVVMRAEHYRAALIVDGVSGVVDVAAERLEPSPDLTDNLAALISGVVNLREQQRIILLLAPSELLTHSELGLLNRYAERQRQAET